ncbi:MAG: cyanophycinase [Gemmatimonadota bacterium]|nr:cyanophycinase [Gemmatimonadota bacterium]
MVVTRYRSSLSHWLPVLALAGTSWNLTAQSCARPCIGPPHGAIFAAGGGILAPQLFRRFVSLAGGRGAHIVLIPTASADDGFPTGWSEIQALKRAGAGTVTVLHTRSRSEADSEAFVEPLETADGVWFTGGRSWRLVDAYLNTRTHDVLRELLDRGGVVGGTSAGASILASYLVRGSVHDNRTMVAPEYDEGFGFLRSVAIDQHLDSRGREFDMLEVLDIDPGVLGLGVDEGTAVVVIGDQLQVMGRGRVAVYNVFDGRLVPLFWLSPGDRYDLSGRRVVAQDPEGMRPGPYPDR